MVHLDQHGGLALELSLEDWYDLKLATWNWPEDHVGTCPTPDYGPPGHYEVSLAELTADWIKRIHDMRRSHWRAGNGLHMALWGFDTDKRTVQQDTLVSLMLEMDCDPREPDGSGQSPLEMAATWANESAVQKLFDAGVFAQTTSGEVNDRQLQVCLHSAGDFRVILQFLRAGANLPTEDDGQMTTEVLKVLRRSLGRAEREDIKPLTAHHAKRFMDSGMRALLEAIFSQLPRQNADEEVFGSLLVIAAAAGDQASVELLLRHGACADSTFNIAARNRPPKNHTALAMASKFGHLGVMETLSNAGAQIKSDDGDGHPLANAVVGGHADAVRALIERGATFPQLDHSYSLTRRSSPRKSLLDLLSGSRSPRQSFQGLAVELDKLETLQYLVVVEGQSDLSALAAACADGKVDFAVCLLEAAAATTPNPLESEGGPLYFACLNGHVDIVRQLMAYGANVNQSVDFGTPLIAAASRGHADIVRLLLDNGADPNHQYQGSRAKRSSSEPSPVGISQLLPPPAPGNPARRRDEESAPCTALSVACREGFPAVAKLLLSGGAAIAYPLDPAIGGSPVVDAIVSTCEGDWSPSKHEILELLLEAAPAEGFWPWVCDGGLSQASRAHNHAAFALFMEYLPLTSWTLVLASHCGSVPSIAHHLNQGINSQIQASNGELPLHVAAYNMHSDAVTYLLTHGGADVNQLDGRNLTPILAALLGFCCLLRDKHPSHEYQADMGIVQFEAAVRCLLDHGARTDLGEDSELGRALDVARLIGHKEVERLLQDREIQDSGLGLFEQSVLVYCGRIGENGSALLEGGYEAVMRPPPSTLQVPVFGSGGAGKRPEDNHDTTEAVADLPTGSEPAHKVLSHP